MVKKKQYHHGNLKQALLLASEQLIDDMGVDALSMRRVTNHIGVSHTAVYRHFASKEELLAAVAEEGFRQMHKMMAEAMVSDDPLERFISCGVAYVQFAVNTPAKFRVMFGPYIPKLDIHPDLAEINACTYDVLQESIKDCQDAGVMCEGPIRVLSLIAWSTVHGLASLMVDHQLDELGEQEISSESIARQVAQLLYQGLKPATS